MKRVKYWAALICLCLAMLSCNTTETILAGATHASGVIHVEGYFTDTQGEVRVCKAPEGDDYCSKALEEEL